MIDYRLIGSRLKAVRESKNMTQEVLAEKASITVVYLSKIENGKVRPTLEVIDSICVNLDCDLGYIFGGSSPNTDYYQQDKICAVFKKLKPEVKPIAMSILENLSKLP
ncbi:MAG: helix-turn-helix transcriptional regulator [Oscillospiraceae bacterium]|nr:helix-turn-helix transcriptional regulator [Oscillospiraceae bacterium]